MISASIRRIVTKQASVRYDAPNTDKGHADRAWALALAVYAAANRPTPVIVPSSVSLARSSYRLDGASRGF